MITGIRYIMQLNNDKTQGGLMMFVLFVNNNNNNPIKNKPIIRDPTDNTDIDGSGLFHLPYYCSIITA